MKMKTKANNMSMDYVKTNAVSGAFQQSRHCLPFHHIEATTSIDTKNFFIKYKLLTENLSVVINSI